jgi:hypothetical protein
LEAYRRDIYANPDPNTMIEDSDEKPIRNMTPVSFSQKIDYCLSNKSIPFLYPIKKNLGQEAEVAITSNIRSELKKYDKSMSVMTMNTLASKITGFKYEHRSIGNHSFRVICGPKPKFYEFLNCEITDDDTNDGA